MHFILVLALIAHLGFCNGNDMDIPEYELNATTLTMPNMTWKQEILTSEYNYVVNVSSSVDSSYSLSVDIENMVCSEYGENFTYLAVESEGFTKYTLCATNEKPPAFSFNDGIQNYGLRTVTLTPVGNWSDRTSATVTAKLVRLKKIIRLGDDVPQLDLILDKTNSDYEIRLDENSKLCNTNSVTGKKNWKCSLVVALNQMTCEKSSGNTLELTWTNSDGIKNTSSWCENHSYSSNPRNIKSIESFKPVILRARNFSKPVKVSISALLSSPSESSCPSNYFNCDQQCKGKDREDREDEKIGMDRHNKYTSSHCIPKEWKCDMTPNCPSPCPNADENKDLCTTTTWEYYEYYPYGLFSMWNLFFFLICMTGVTTLFCIVRSLYHRRLRRNAGTVRRTEGQVNRPVDTQPPPSYSKATGMPIPNRN